MKDRKTTVWGLVAFAGLIMTTVAAAIGGVTIDNDTVELVVRIIGDIVAAVGVGGLGFAAADSKH